MYETNPVSCAICGSEETTGRWHAKRAYAFLPVCESCRTGEHFAARYGIMLEQKSLLRKPGSHILHALTWCAHDVSFDGDCDGCTKESDGAVFVDIDDAGQKVPRRYMASLTRATVI